MHESFRLPTDDGPALHLHRWSAEPPRALLLIVHGMAEHGGRYARFAERLGATGIQTYAYDQRGHGLTCSAETERGHFADRNGWDALLRDLREVCHHLRREHPGLPLFLFAHSMGSFLALNYLLHHSCSLQGVILSGSGWQPALQRRAGQWLAKLERLRQGPLGRSPLLERLSFGAFNRRVGPTRSAFDWLSRDEQEVARYLNDPLCGFRCSNQAWLDLLGGLQRITPRSLRQIDSQLPVLLIGGDQDPVAHGNGLQRLAQQLRQAGLHEVGLHLYPGARHELLNETNRDEVQGDLLHWLQQRLARQAPNLTDQKETP